VIPVNLAAEPPNFNAEVRQPGLAFLKNNNIAPDTPLPNGTQIPPLWQGKWNQTLWRSYSGVCAYLALYFEFATGASSTDHFVPKSLMPGLAYEWRNYRLACLAINRKKSTFTDIMDPFEITPDTFTLRLVDGVIRPNKQKTAEVQQAAQRTIDRLNLNSPEHTEWRSRHFNELIKGERQSYTSPFVHHEMERQRLL
jgi:uncharacterized protein (TIGR02646 family)